MHDDLIALAEAARVVGPDTIAIAGASFSTVTEPPGASVGGDCDEDAVDRPTALPSGAGPENQLATLLYRHCYVRPCGAAIAAADPCADRDFESGLRRSNTGGGAWEQGWVEEGESADGRLVAARYGVRFFVSPDGRGAGTGPGEPDRIRVPHEYLQLLPRFYLMVGDAGSGAPARASGVAVRLYWHLTSAVAQCWVAAVSGFLNAGAIPFRAKLLSTPGRYRRADAGVLYLAREDFHCALGPLAQIYSEVSDGLRADPPLLTKRIASGLGLAEDPGTGLSFGRHLCTLVAKALWASHESDGRSDARARRRAIETVFQQEGLDPDAPYLRPGSIDDYDAGPFERAGRRTARASPDAPLDRDGRGEVGGVMVPAAVRIGRAICSAAHWDSAGRRCNWLGRSNTATVTASGRVSTMFAALGPDIYRGLGGIALFLGELFACTGEAAFRRTALGAINCALGQLEQRSAAAPPSALGFYSGVAGVAFAVSRTRLQTGDGGASDRPLESLRRAMATRDRAGADDLLSGRAGAILALLSLSRQDGWAECREWAVALGDELSRAEVIACDQPRAIDYGEGVPPLAGLSHGAAGIGLALLALHAETRRRDYLIAGRRAFAYEDALFDRGEGNWPDLRPPMADASDSSSRRFMVAWCHGAPGIGLARLRASRLDTARAGDHLAHARTALNTTLKALERRRPLDAFDASPCHGTTGLIESLLTGHLMLDESRYGAAALGMTRRLADAATARNGWLSAACLSALNPSLMVGAAGIGYHFLRTHSPVTIPSLLIGPDPTALVPGAPCEPAASLA